MPVFWLGLVGLLLFYAKLGWVEGPGRIDVGYEDIVPTVTGLMTVDALLAGEPRRVLERAAAIWCCRRRSWAICRWPMWRA